MRRILFAAARALRGSGAQDGLSDDEESIADSEVAIPTAALPDEHQETTTAAATATPPPPSSKVADTAPAHNLSPVRTVPAAPAQPSTTAPPPSSPTRPSTPTRRRSSRMPMALRRIGASPEVMKSPHIASSYNLRSRRRAVPSTRTDSVAMSRPAFLHKRDVENASSTTLRNVCNRFGIDATGTREEMRARALAKMAEKTADDFSARPTDEQDNPGPVTVDRECTDERTNCLTTSTTKKNLASVNDPIVRGVGDVHGKSDVPDADVNLPPAPPQMPLESKPARSWVTDRSVMEKPLGQGPPPTPPLSIPRAALPPRGLPPSPSNNLAESVDGSAPLNASNIFQDWFRTNRHLSAAEYNACVQALRGSVKEGKSLRRSTVKAPGCSGNLGVAMVPSAIAKRAPVRSVTVGLPSPVAATVMRTGMPTTPGVRSSTGIPASNRLEVTQQVTQNEERRLDATESQQKRSTPVPNDVTSERNLPGVDYDLLRRLQRCSQSTPVDASSTAVRKETEGALNGERPLPPRFSGAVGGPNDRNIDRSGVARGSLENDKKKEKPPLDADWLDRLLGDKFKDIPMKENPQIGDMVTPQQLLKHFNEGPVPKTMPNNGNSGNVTARNGVRKRTWDIRPHPRETVARIRKLNQERARQREWEERLRVLDKQKREEACRSMYQKNPIESESGGELIDLRNALNQKKTVYELARIRAGLQHPPSPPLPPRAKRALRFLKALKDDTSEMQVHARKPDCLPPLPPRLKKVRIKGKFTDAASFFGDASSDSSVDYERPPDEIILYNRIMRRKLKAQRKLKEKEEREGDNSINGGESSAVNGTDVVQPIAANMSDGNEKQRLEKKRSSVPGNPSPQKTSDMLEGMRKETRERARHLSRSFNAKNPFKAPLEDKLGPSPVDDSKSFEAHPKVSPKGFDAPPVSSSPFGTGKATFGRSERPAAEGNKDNYGKPTTFQALDASKSDERGISKLEGKTSERKDAPPFLQPQVPRSFGFRTSSADKAKVKFNSGIFGQQGARDEEQNPVVDKGHRESGVQRKRKIEDVEAAPISFDRNPTNNSYSALFPTQVEREGQMRGVSDGVKDDIEPASSNGKTSIPSLPSSTVPALANSQSPSVRFGKDISLEEAEQTTITGTGVKIRTATDRQRGHGSNGTENVIHNPEPDEQAQEASLFSAEDPRPPVFGREAATIAKPKEDLKQNSLGFNSFLSKPIDLHPKKNEEKTTEPNKFAFLPSKPKEASESAVVPPREGKLGFEYSGKDAGPASAMFRIKATAPSTDQKPSDQCEQDPSVAKPAQNSGNPFLGEKPDTKEERKSDATNPLSTKEQGPFTFDAANPSSKTLFEKPSFGSQNTSENPFSLEKANSTGERPSEDVMATNESPVDRKESKSLFGIESSEPVAGGKPFGGFKPPSVAPAPVFGSAQTQTPSAPFSFSKSVDSGQKQLGGPFGDSKFGSSFKSTGPASSFVFGAGNPSHTANPSAAAQTPFSASASKPQTAPTKPNPFAAPPDSSPFTAAPTGFGTSSQSQGFSFSGSSSAFGSSNPVDKPSAFGSSNFGDSSTTGFGQGGSKPTFAFGTGPAGASAPTFVTPSGNAAPSPFGAPNPTQSTFGAQSFGAQQESRPLFGATPGAPFPQGNPFGGNNNNSQSALSGRANEAPGGSNAFNAQVGQPSGPGAFAMGSTAGTRRKLKGRRMLR